MKALVRAQGGTAAARRSRGGRGGSAAARIPVRHAPQRVAIKTRVINHGKYRGQGGATKAIQDEVAYLKRDGASLDGEQGIAFDSKGSLSGEELKAFRERLVPDRHHFRIMVSPEAGTEMDMPVFARDLVQTMQKDLGTHLEWFGVAHYDTDNPHVHLVVRGKDQRGRDLVISRDYISHGMRLQAGELATLRLGPRRAEDIAQSLARDLKAERVTVLDRHIDRQRMEHPEGLVSALRGRSGELAREQERVRLLGRLQHLESLGLAREIRAGIWRPDLKLLERLKALSLKGDIVKTLHARMTGNSYAPDPLVLDAQHLPREVFVGRVIARGKVDEFWDDEYLLLDTQKGRVVYLPLTGVVQRGQASVRSIVRLEAEQGRASVTPLAQDLPAQVSISGVTDLDRELARTGGTTARRPTAQGFAAEYQQALEQRANYLKEIGLADHHEGRWQVRSGFLDQLYARELEAAHARLKSRFGERRALSPGDSWRGTVVQIEELPSGPHAVVAGGGQHALVPATPALERALHRTVQLKVTSPPTLTTLEPQTRQWTLEISALKRGLGVRRS